MYNIHCKLGFTVNKPELARCLLKWIEEKRNDTWDAKICYVHADSISPIRFIQFLTDPIDGEIVRQTILIYGSGKMLMSCSHVKYTQDGAVMLAQFVDKYADRFAF